MHSRPALLQEAAVLALAALCSEYYALETGEADPARQGEWACRVWVSERCLLLQVDRVWEGGARAGS